MDPINEAGGVQPQPTDDRPWAGLGFRMEVAAPPAGGEAAAGSEGGAGDAQGGSLDGLYDLGSVPEELRPYVENVAKQIQGNVTRSFQDHADFRKTWEPFQNVEGLTDVPPEELSELVQFRQIASDPETFAGWLGEVASTLADANPELFEQAFGELLGGDEEDGDDLEGGGGIDEESLRQMFSEMLDERLGPIEQSVNHQSQEQRVQQAREQIAGQVQEIQKKHQDTFGEELDKDAIEHVQRLALTLDDPDTAIEQAYQQHLRITGQAQGELIDEKLGQPQPGVNGAGRADTSPEAYGADDPDLKKAALQRLRAG
jgi:hypothetical protein